MKLALIVPVDLLDRYASQSDGVHLVLAHIVLTSPIYANWYRQRSEAGDTIILDNGAYEFNEPLPADQLIHAAELVNASTVVAPDFPGRPWQQTHDIYRRFRDQLPTRFGIFACPQSALGDADGWMRCFEEFSLDHERLTHIGVSILACPNAFRTITNTNSIELNRFVAAAAIRRNTSMLAQLRRFNIRLHFLGLGEWTLAHLISTYDDIGASIDTKRPLKRSLSVMKPMDLRDITTPSPSQHANIQLDIDLLQFYATGGREATKFGPAPELPNALR